MQQQANALFDEQMHSWPLAAKNFSDLSNVQTKTFDFDGFSVKVQFNPARIVLSGAKTDAKTIATRRCFLCAENRPAEQRGITCGDYEILVNPFPIFRRHFTLPRVAHEPQQIAPYFSDLLFFARALNESVVFYNGPCCGASAPDHMHFQAGEKEFLPLLRDFENLKNRVELVERTGLATTSVLRDYLRTVFCIEGRREDALQIAFLNLYNHLMTEPLVEPMMNIVASYDDERWRIFVFPRVRFRPWQYDAEDDRRLLISPGTVEMSGIFVTPLREHFERITKDDVADIYAQISLKI